MTDQLKEALVRLVEAATTTVTARFTDEREIPALVAAISDARDVLARGDDAARRFANLTSPENIEAAAKALFLHDGNFSARVWDALQHDSKEEWRGLAEAVLRPLEETPDV